MEKSISHGEEFLVCLTKLKPEEFFGIAHSLGVKLLTQDVDPETKKAIPRPATDIIDDLITKYGEYNHADRRFLLGRLKRITKGR